MKNVAKPISEAVKEVKEGAKASFDETVEVHINLNLDAKKGDQNIRTTVDLPHGTGKEIKVATMSSDKVSKADLQLTESDISKIEKGQIKPKADFDVLIVEPKFMSKLAKLGAILGPAGVMPNPKTGTVTEDVAKAVEAFKKGKVEVRSEQEFPMIHAIIGKVSYSEKQLEENLQAILDALKQSKPSKAKPDWIKSCYITSTMGKSVQVDVSTL